MVCRDGASHGSAAGDFNGPAGWLGQQQYGSRMTAAGCVGGNITPMGCVERHKHVNLGSVWQVDVEKTGTDPTWGPSALTHKSLNNHNTS